ncbi:VIT family protein [Hydrogenovibrio crunogenus]|uniref:VIT family protein n=1 Tax=Hydrogenovibrio crunogenus TaxID=39765 RepID=A0A4P7NWE1_9GAMM|nr:VIT family protein [Hydrogenovibrio crunogenus]QBZ82003.1 VIT family protein [Hydrogenovibrio crunogenus]RUM92554.1 MAG: VIT family protein [Thiomicrospira sp.]
MAHFTEEMLDTHLTEEHFSHRMGWLRAAVLGANDGIISVVSLLVGVIASGAEKDAILLVAVAALVAGALSMAAGEYVSVSSQSDTEKADLEKEKIALEEDWETEHAELALIYRQRGVSEATANQVATELMEHDALGAHARDELGLSEIHTARPLQAAFASAASFVSGAAVPVILVAILPMENLGIIIASSSLALLAILGAIAAKTGGADMLKGALRMSIWGFLAMALTTYVGLVFGAMG